jgi:hypothetical protein
MSISGFRVKRGWNWDLFGAPLKVDVRKKNGVDDTWV